MSPLLMVDVTYDSDESWESFSMIHGMSHQTVYEFMARRNLAPFYPPLYDFPKDRNDDYLLDHYKTHLSNAILLGLPGFPDLSSVDLSNPSEMKDWLAYHALVHQQENRALGIL